MVNRRGPHAKKTHYSNQILETGDVIHLRVPGKSLVILNTYDACKSVMDKRAHSDRPHRAMLDEL
jgi:hypothetical protein